jgi:type II secretory pathway component HofQ
MSLFLVLAAMMPQIVESVDFPALDAAIERCERASVLPVFAAEAQRRSAAVTAFYQEQVQIAAERLATTSKRRALREGAAPSATGHGTPATDQELALRQLALDDRQRALDDQRRLETMRQEAVDLKRQYFLTKCAASKKPG